MIVVLLSLERIEEVTLKITNPVNEIRTEIVGLFMWTCVSHANFQHERTIRHSLTRAFSRFHCFNSKTCLPFILLREDSSHFISSCWELIKESSQLYWRAKLLMRNWNSRQLASRKTDELPLALLYVLFYLNLDCIHFLCAHTFLRMFFCCSLFALFSYSRCAWIVDYAVVSRPYLPSGVRGGEWKGDTNPHVCVDAEMVLTR